MRFTDVNLRMGNVTVARGDEPDKHNSNVDHANL